MVKTGIPEIDNLIFGGMFPENQFPVIISENREDLIWLANLFTTNAQRRGISTTIKRASDITTTAEAIVLYKQMCYWQRFLIILNRANHIPKTPTILNTPAHLELICKYHLIFSGDYLYEVRNGVGNFVNIAKIRGQSSQEAPNLVNRSLL